jgi:hypothetical protein
VEQMEASSAAGGPALRSHEIKIRAPRDPRTGPRGALCHLCSAYFIFYTNLFSSKFKNIQKTFTYCKCVPLRLITCYYVNIVLGFTIDTNIYIVFYNTC